MVNGCPYAEGERVSVQFDMIDDEDNRRKQWYDGTIVISSNNSDDGDDDDDDDEEEEGNDLPALTDRARPVLCRMSDDLNGEWERFETAKAMAEAKGLPTKGSGGVDRILAIAGKRRINGRSGPPTKIGGGGHWSAYTSET